MKKIFSIILFLSFTLMYSQAQTINYDVTYNKKVSFKNQTEGTKNDSILVVNSAGLQSYIKQTSLKPAPLATPTLNQVLIAGNTSTNPILLNESGGSGVGTYAGGYSVIQNATTTVYTNGNGIDIQNTSGGQKLSLRKDFITIQDSGSNGVSISRENITPGVYTQKIQDKNGTIALLGDIPTISPVSATQSGIVNNVPLQELGGVDKVINFVRIGRGAGTVNNSTAIGFNVLSNNISGTNNTGLGARALQDNTTGTVNSAFGSQSLWRNTTGNGNIGFGAASLYNNTIGDNNLGIGYYSLFNNVSGFRNIGIGYLAGSAITTGNRNVIIATTPDFNTNGITTGSNNLIVSPNDGNTTGITTGSGNVILGKVSGLPSSTENTIILSDGVGNIAIRKEADNRLLAPTLTNALIDSGGNKSLVTKEYLDAHSGGGSQTLQQTLDNGKAATYGTNSVHILDNSDGSLYNSFSTANTVDKTSIFQLPTSINIQSSKVGELVEGSVSVREGGVFLSKFLDGNTTVVQFAEPTVSTTLQFPAKTVEGEIYTLATTDDIRLQKIVDNSAIAYRGSSYMGLLYGPNKDTEINSTNEGAGTDASPINYTNYTQSNGNIILNSTSQNETDGNKSAVLTVIPDNINMMITGGGGSGSSTKVSFRAPENPNTELYFPSLPNISGGYDIATTKDVSLQKMVDNTALAYRGDSYAAILAGPDKLSKIFKTNEGTGTDLSPLNITEFTQGNYFSFTASAQDEAHGNRGASVIIGPEQLEFQMTKDGNYTRLSFQEPQYENCQLILPSKPYTSYGYTIATLDDLVPKISIITGDLTVPEGYANRYITVSSGSGHTVTLPSVSSSVGSMYHVTGNIAGFNYLATTGGLNDIMFQGTTFNEYEIAGNTGVILINDGLHWVVVGRYPW